jgi:hypothetical protein
VPVPLDVIGVYSNPLGLRSRRLLFNLFEQHMLDSGARLTTIECAFGTKPFELLPHGTVNRVQVRAQTLLWHKENLANIAETHLPADATAVALIDGDVHFRDPHWAQKTLDALQHYPVVQPWGNCYDLGPKGEHLELHTSFCRVFYEGLPISAVWQKGYTFPHPGYAWAWRREALHEVGGFIDTAICGAGDHHMAYALLGRVRETAPMEVTPGYIRPLYGWQFRAKALGEHLGYVPGTIEHHWHGPKASRSYVERWQIITSNAFDPATDLKKNADGVYELALNKPRLRRDLDRYFRGRMEDQTVL